MEKDIVKLEESLNDLKKGGTDITQVWQLLEIAKDKTNTAKQELQMKNYGSASQLVFEAENMVKTTQDILKSSSFEITNLNLLIFGIILTVMLVLIIGKFKFTITGNPMKNKKETPRWPANLLGGLGSLLAPDNCPKCGRRMVEVYRDNKLVGHRCTKCKFMKYKK